MKEYPLNLDIIILKSAFLYALSKKSYVVSHVCDVILKNWDFLLEDDKDFFVDEIRQCNTLSEFEAEIWNKIIKKYKTELESGI